MYRSSVLCVCVFVCVCVCMHVRVRVCAGAGGGFWRGQSYHPLRQPLRQLGRRGGMQYAILACAYTDASLLHVLQCVRARVRTRTCAHACRHRHTQTQHILTLTLTHSLNHSHTEQEHNYLVDADAIFIYQSIRKVQPEVQIVVEMVNITNATFLEVIRCDESSGREWAVSQPLGGALCRIGQGHTLHVGDGERKGRRKGMTHTC
jgi:hypothetical protein